MEHIYLIKRVSGERLRISESHQPNVQIMRMSLIKGLSKLKIKEGLLLSTNLFILAIPLAMAPISGTTEQVALAKSEIKLVVNDSNVVKSISTKPTIVPGESSEQKIAREKAEADAKALADAKAKAQAEAQKKLAVSERNVVARENRVYNDPSNFDQIYQEAGNKFGVSPLILKAVHTVETGASGSTSRANASSGAQGPMQFLPSTWRNHSVDGNGDGYADINNVVDAIYTAAKYLKDCGYPDVKKALWGYNPSLSYYNKVMNVARSLGYSS